MQIYNRFEHTFTDRQHKMTLVSLKFANVDWGAGQRFLEPITHADETKAFTYELKFEPVLSNTLPHGGWNFRAVLIDLIACKFQVGSWEKLPPAAFKLESDFKKLTLFWKDVSNFSSPDLGKGKTSILKVDEDFFEFKDWHDTVKVVFSQLTKIHFSKYPVNTLEIPNLVAEVKNGTRNYNLNLPQDMGHPFYVKLEKLNWLKKEDLKKFLESPQVADLTVMSTLGGIEFATDQGFAQTKAEPGIISNGELIQWQNIKFGQAPVANAQIGNLKIAKLEISENRKVHKKFPAHSFYFNFSGVNQHEDRDAIVHQFGQWSDILKTESQVEFHEDWSSFFDLKNAVVLLHVSYSDSEGFGSLELNPEFYRKLLFQQPQFQTDFAPNKNFKFKEPAFHIKDEYGFDPQQIFPTPDALHKTKLHFWSDGQGKVGLSDQGFLYVWNKEDLESFQDDVSDEYGDRGGPYYESVLRFKNKASIRLSAGGEEIKNAKEFLK